MKLKKSINTLFILFLSFYLSKITAQNFTPTFSISQQTTHKIPKDQDFTFGYLEVLENRKKGNSKTIKLPVYIFKSRGEKPKKDPIIYTVGGPGSTTMPSAQYMKYYKYLDDRDFILVEQRGNYFAKPHLDCPEWSKAIYTSNLPGFNLTNKDALFKQAAKKCKEKLVERGIDLNSYNTNEIAADINDLVNVLQIEKYNLLTISYSTKIAQVLMRDYPNKIRSVVMDSPLPLEVNYDEQSIKNLLESITKLLSDCSSDKKCNATFPNIENRFFNFLIEKNKNPIEINVKNPKNNKIELFYVKGIDLLTVFTSASTGDVTSIPFEINKLLNNDFSFIIQQLSYLFEGPENGAGLGMRLSVWCSEEYPFNNQKVIESEKHKYPETKGISPAVFEKEICKIWGVKKVSKIENMPIKSNIPVLLINGEYDNETPAKWAKSMSKNLTNSYHFIFKGWKHTPTTNWSNQCAMQLANDFFNNPKIKPESSCFESISEPNFKTE